MDQVVVRETLSVISKNITEEDKEIAAGYSRLAREVLARAIAVIRTGHPEKELLIVERVVLSNLGKMAAVDSKVEVEASRVEFLATMERMRAVEGHLSDVDVKALARFSDDQDAELEGSEV